MGGGNGIGSGGGSFAGGGKMGRRSSQRAVGASHSISGPGAGFDSRGPQKPAGDNYTPHYNGFPQDRVMQAVGMVGSVLSGSVTGLVSGVAMDDGTMTKPDGWSKFGKEMDTGGGLNPGQPSMLALRRRRVAAQIGNTLGINDASLGA